MRWPLLFFVKAGFMAFWLTKTLRRGSSAGLPTSEFFSGHFVHVLRYQFETWYILLLCSATHRVRVSSQPCQSDLIYSQKCIKVIIIHLWPQKPYRALKFCKHTNLTSVLTTSDFRRSWAIVSPLVATNTICRVFFCMLWDRNLKPGINIR